jgi:hypothetical protein
MARGRLPTSSVDASPTKRTLWLAGTTADWTPQPPVKQGVERPDVPEFWLLELTYMSKPNASIVWPPIGTHNELALEGFAGNNWWKFETEMAKYGAVSKII